MVFTLICGHPLIPLGSCASACLSASCFISAFHIEILLFLLQTYPLDIIVALCLPAITTITVTPHSWMLLIPVKVQLTSMSVQINLCGEDSEAIIKGIYVSIHLLITGHKVENMYTNVLHGKWTGIYRVLFCSNWAFKAIQALSPNQTHSYYCFFFKYTRNLSNNHTLDE